MRPATGNTTHFREILLKSAPFFAYILFYGLYTSKQCLSSHANICSQIVHGDRHQGSDLSSCLNLWIPFLISDPTFAQSPLNAIKSSASLSSKMSDSMSIILNMSIALTKPHIKYLLNLMNYTSKMSPLLSNNNQLPNSLQHFVKYNYNTIL